MGTEGVWGMKTKYEIRLEGCDDSTIFIMELDENEKILVEEISRLSKKASTYGCMPVLHINPINEEGENE
jgi:hypothetical protein